MNMELADDLWTRGAGHVHGAQALVREARRAAVDGGVVDVEQVTFNGRYSASIHLLIGFAFELLLKTAYLLHGGNPQALGPRGIGHDLMLALDKAEEQGFKSTVPHLKWIIEHLREAHHKHQFRYGGRDSIQMPGLELTLPALEALAQETGDRLRTLTGRGA